MLFADFYRIYETLGSEVLSLSRCINPPTDSTVHCSVSAKQVLISAVYLLHIRRTEWPPDCYERRLLAFRRTLRQGSVVGEQSILSQSQDKRVREAALRAEHWNARKDSDLEPEELSVLVPRRYFSLYCLEISRQCRESDVITIISRQCQEVYEAFLRRGESLWCPPRCCHKGWPLSPALTQPTFNAQLLTTRSVLLLGKPQ